MQTSPTAGSYITELTNGVSTQLYTHTNLDQIVEYHANITGESVVGLFSPSKQFQLFIIEKLPPNSSTFPKKSFDVHDCSRAAF